MRLNLGCGNDIRVGYENIDIMPPTGAKFGNFRTLSAADNSVEEILAIDILRYIAPHDIVQVIQQWYNKLQKGGRLFIESPDYELIGNSMAYGYLDVNAINQLIFGPPDSKIPSVALYSLNSIEDVLQHLGFHLISKFYNNIAFNITVTKP